LFCSWRISIKMAADEVSELLRTFETALKKLKTLCVYASCPCMK